MSNLPLMRHSFHDRELDGISRPMRNNVVIEKGVVLTNEYLESIRGWLEEVMTYFSVYPDIFLDLIQPEEKPTDLFFYQRILLRAVMRFKQIYATAPRSFSKSFLTILAEMIECIFLPGTKRFICAPNKNQGAQIAKEKILEIYERWPLIMNEVEKSAASAQPGSFGKDQVTLTFKSKSVFDVVGALDSQRGGRRNGGLVDEIRDHEEGPINEIVLPLMTVSRRLPDSTVNEKEPNQQRIFMTSAGSKTSFAYDKLMDVFETSIINPNAAFVFGCDYRIPMLHGLIDKDFILDLKMSTSYSIESFSREFLSIWSGANDESWFSFDKMQKYRKLKNPETRAMFKKDSKHFYFLSVDVGRLHDQTVVCVFKVFPSDDGYRCSLVNLYVLGREAKTKTFTRQALDLKKIIKAFQPREVLIDTNGLGIGLAEEMMKVSIDEETGEEYPAYGFFNNDDFKKVQPKDSIQILYSMKANSSLKAQIHSNCYSRLHSGRVRFLVKEQEAKANLLATEVGQKMNLEKRVRRLMPHEMTTKLFEEMSNLRLKRTAGLDIVLEPINTRCPDDKFSAFEYGLWRIKELEDEATKKAKRRGIVNRKLVFYSGGE